MGDVPFVDEVWPGHRQVEQVQIAGAQQEDGTELVAFVVTPIAKHGSTPLVQLMSPDIARLLAGQLLDTADWCEREAEAPEGNDA